jgi:hypothetical protein
MVRWAMCSVLQTGPASVHLKYATVGLARRASTLRLRAAAAWPFLLLLICFDGVWGDLRQKYGVNCLILPLIEQG